MADASQEAPQTREEKFFGKKTTIDEMVAQNEDAAKEAAKEEEIAVEEGDEFGVVEPEPIATPDKPALKEEAQESKTGDEELDTYSEKVQKRIDKLTWEREEAKREAKKAAAIRDEAVRYAQTVNQQNQQQANIIATGEARLVEQIKQRAAMAVDAASNEYRTAYESGDPGAIIEAQKKLTLAQAEQLESFNYERDYNQRVQNWQQQQQRNAYYQQQAAQRPPVQPQQQQQSQTIQPTPESQSWAAKNPWFGKPEHRDMTAIAYAEHERVIRDEGLKADSPEYYAAIDAKVRKHFPDFFQSERGREPNTVVASGERNNSGKPRTVRLTPHQVSLAKTLGLTPEEYARQALKEQNNG